MVNGTRRMHTTLPQNKKNENITKKTKATRAELDKISYHVTMQLTQVTKQQQQR
jgi:hypothetical protein